MSLNWIMLSWPLRCDGWRRIDAKLAEARFRRGRYAVELEALGRRLTLRTAEAPGEVAAVWYDAAAAVEFEG